MFHLCLHIFGCLLSSYNFFEKDLYERNPQKYNKKRTNGGYDLFLALVSPNTVLYENKTRDIRGGKSSEKTWSSRMYTLDAINTGR